MNVDRHAAAVVGDLERAVRVEHDVDLLRVARDGLVDAIVDDFVSEVIRPRRVRVHTGPAAHGLEPAQDFYVGSAIIATHRSGLTPERSARAPT
jgi:hypothetical protein